MVSLLSDFIQKPFELVFLDFLRLYIGVSLFHLSGEFGNFSLQEFFLVNNLLIFFFNKSFLLLAVSFTGLYFILKSLVPLLLWFEFIVCYEFLFLEALNFSLQIFSLQLVYFFQFLGRKFLSFWGLFEVFYFFFQKIIGFFEFDLFLEGLEVLLLFLVQIPPKLGD